MKDKYASRERLTFEQIVTNDTGFIFRSLARFGVPGDALEDVAQEVLCGVFRALPGFLPTRARLRTWIYKIAFYQAQAFLNRAHRRREVFALRAEDFEPLTADGPSPEEQTSTHQDRRLMFALIRAIEPQRRAVFIAYEIEGMTMLEIAEALNIPVSTGWSRLQQARRALDGALRRRLGAWPSRSLSGRHLPKRTAFSCKRRGFRASLTFILFVLRWQNIRPRQFGPELFLDSLNRRVFLDNGTTVPG